MPLRVVALFLISTGCAFHADVDAAPPTRASRCATPPALAAAPFRHTRSSLFTSLGSARHRGIDLIAMESDATQTLGGKLAYGAIDKDIADEDVELFACVEERWRSIATVRTGRDGRFAHTLEGPRRLPPGLHDLLAFVPGDDSRIWFLAYVAPAGARVIVSDVDGTLTESEEAILNTVVFGDDIAHRSGAPEALAASKHPIVYVTARGDQLTEVTRLWLRIHGFPRGPLRLARAPITPPGPRTVAFKTAALRELPVPIAAGIGNRATDVEAYARAGLSPPQILIARTELAQELLDDFAARRATPFDHYRDLAALLPRSVADR